MKVHTLSVGALSTNCYVVEENDSCLIIDPGDSAEYILEFIVRRRLTPVALLATHGHFDHIMAVGEIQLSYDIPFYIHEKDMFLVDRLENTARHFLDHKPVMFQPTNLVFFSKEDFSLSTFHFQLMHSSGHTPGSCCFYFQKSELLFTGDTLFANGLGSYEHSYSNKDQLIKSVKEVLTMPGETRVLPGHGEEASISAARVIEW